MNTLTEGRLFYAMLKFSVPYLIASFLQTFYGMADLIIVGQYNGADVVTAVSVGSQVMHMLTVMLVGFAMGTTVSISHAVGAGDRKTAAQVIGNSVRMFGGIAIGFTLLLILGVQGILWILHTPPESVQAAREYLLICFLGIPFVTAYNVQSSIFRGLGNTKSPMLFVAFAGIINVVLDVILIGPFHMGAKGAALATVIAQALSVVLAGIFLKRELKALGIRKEHFAFQSGIAGKVTGIGFPIACQDGFIQISFLVITAIANGRGVDVAAAVGIVEKLIGFLFLVPSSMLSAVSAIVAQNAGAGKHERSKETLRYGIRICLVFGAAVFLLSQIVPSPMVHIFVKNEPQVVRLGAEYLRAYSLDCMIAGVHFCYSGFFSAYGKSMYSFWHNVISILAMRIPGAYAASVLFPQTLYPMGLAAPLGSLISVLICLFLYRRFIGRGGELRYR